MSHHSRRHSAPTFTTTTTATLNSHSSSSIPQNSNGGNDNDDEPSNTSNGPAPALALPGPPVPVKVSVQPDHKKRRQSLPNYSKRPNTSSGRLSRLSNNAESQSQTRLHTRAVSLDSRLNTIEEVFVSTTPLCV